MILMSRIAHELLGQLGKSETNWTPSVIPSRLMREIILALEGNVINGELADQQTSSWRVGTTGKSIIRHIISHPSPSATLASILKELGLDTSAPAGDLEETCRSVIGDLPDIATTIRKGNEKPVMRLVGEVMKRSKGRADPKEARRILMEILKE
jgi:aspartyl-tRNA(Asn)/glutamyl-tRNA(Gln) amidotransferase subunit B